MIASAAQDVLRRVCIVGGGPAGFYAAMNLSKNLPSVNIDIIEKLPVPFGLIRYGVAPDHPEVKNVINQFTKVAKQHNVNFYGNITLGKDINVSDLQQHYDAVLLTFGAEEDKTLGIKNEDAINFVAARNFVGWYNGLPSARNLKIDLSGEKAAILGQGNVALDVARVLLTPIDELRKTDIPEHALDKLAQSKVRELFLVGRRGPLQVAFTIKELREQLKLKNCKTVWRENDFTGVSDIVKNLVRPRKRLTELMLQSLKETKTQCISKEDKLFRPIFFRSPKEILVDSENKVTGIKLICTKLVGEKLEELTCVNTEDIETLDCNLAFRSIGYKSVQVDKGLEYTSTGLIVNEKGRVKSNYSEDIGKLYVAGWLGTGPVGVILHTMGNAFQVAKTIGEDLLKIQTASKGGFEEIKEIVLKNNTQIVDWEGWERIDKYEIEEGKKKGKPREKICSVEKMIEVSQKIL